LLNIIQLSASTQCTVHSAQYTRLTGHNMQP